MRCLIVALFLAASASAQWRTDYPAARAEAKRTGKPLLVLFRCEPCVDFVKFDPQVSKSDQFDAFVKVRLTRITGIDLSLVEFDYDLSWAAFFLSPEEGVYGRYGGRDAAGDMNRISLAGLKYAADKALVQHQTRAKEKPPERKPILAEELRGYKTRKRNDCLHCHQVNTFQWADAKAAGTWTREMVRGYPPPENIGLTLEVDRGDVVKSVVAGTPAAKAGLQAGDFVSKLNGLPISSYADAQFALHKATGPIAIEWRRDRETMTGKLEVAEGWRNTDPAWRTSRLDLTPTLPLSGESMNAVDKKALGLPETQAAIRQDKFVHSTLRAVGLKANDVIVALNGHAVSGDMEDFLAFVRREYLVGDEVVLNVLREGKPQEIKVKLK